MNVKAHIRATEDIQNNQTDGGALCDATCSASSLLEEMTAEFLTWFSLYQAKHPKNDIACNVKFHCDGQSLAFK